MEGLVYPCHHPVGKGSKVDHPDFSSSVAAAGFPWFVDPAAVFLAAG